MRYYTCTGCGRPKPASAYARWGLITEFWARVCGARGACDDCLTAVSRYPVHRPYPVVVVADQSRPQWQRSGPAA